MQISSVSQTLILNLHLKEWLNCHPIKGQKQQVADVINCLGKYYSNFQYSRSIKKKLKLYALSQLE